MDRLEKMGIKTIYTKEPFSEDLKDLIQKYSLPNNARDYPYVNLFLLAADRTVHVKFIKDTIKENNIVISDRYLISSCVYQQIQRIPLEYIEQINSFCILPDIIFYLKVSQKERLKRLKSGNRMRNTFFFNKTNLLLEEKLYKEVIEKYKNKWKIRIIDGEIKPSLLHDRIVNFLFDD
jgi:dTMP kinase